MSRADSDAAWWPGEIAPDPERAHGLVKKLRAALGPQSAQNRPASVLQPHAV